MNSQFIFHGKEYEYDNWVFGRIAVDFHDNTIVFIVDNGVYTRVYPESVGQYSTFDDMDGTMMFKGDVVDYDGKRALIDFRDGAFGYELEDHAFVPFCDVKASFVCTHMKVVGKIYDNNTLWRKAKKPC